MVLEFELHVCTAIRLNNGENDEVERTYRSLLHQNDEGIWSPVPCPGPFEMEPSPSRHCAVLLGCLTECSACTARLAAAGPRTRHHGGPPAALPSPTNAR